MQVEMSKSYEVTVTVASLGDAAAAAAKHLADQVGAASAGDLAVSDAAVTVTAEAAEIAMTVDAADQAQSAARALAVARAACGQLWDVDQAAVTVRPGGPS